MSVKCHDVRKYATEGEVLRGFAESIDEFVVPATALSYIFEDLVQVLVDLFQSFEHALRRTIRCRCSVDGRQVPTDQCSGPYYRRKDSVFKYLSLRLCRLAPGQDFHHVIQV